MQLARELQKVLKALMYSEHVVTLLKALVSRLGHIDEYEAKPEATVEAAVAQPELADAGMLPYADEAADTAALHESMADWGITPPEGVVVGSGGGAGGDGGGAVAPDVPPPDVPPPDVPPLQLASELHKML